jgi:prepilin-type N-terminal cleavage/methylation domain-containing protein
VQKIIIKNNAFTLAEVLITLLVIGVVTSLTIPAIISETEKAETAVQVKKYQSVLQQAVMSIKNEYGSVLDSPLNSDNDQENGWNTFKTYLNLVKDCGMYGQSCFANGIYKRINGNNFEDMNALAFSKGILQDGSSIELQIKTNCSTNRSSNNSGPLYNSNCALIYIDINGYKLPNRHGRDLFGWYIMKDGTVYPVGSLDDMKRGCDPNSTDTTQDNDGAPGTGEGCTAKVIQEGKINY